MPIETGSPDPAAALAAACYRLRDEALEAFERLDAIAAGARREADDISARVSDRRNQYGGPYSVWQTTEDEADEADFRAELLRQIANTVMAIASVADDAGFAFENLRAQAPA